MEEKEGLVKKKKKKPISKPLTVTANNKKLTLSARTYPISSKV